MSLDFSMCRSTGQMFLPPGQKSDLQHWDHRQKDEENFIDMLLSCRAGKLLLLSLAYTHTHATARIVTLNHSHTHTHTYSTTHRRTVPTTHYQLKISLTWHFSPLLNPQCPFVGHVHKQAKHENNHHSFILTHICWFCSIWVDVYKNTFHKRHWSHHK